MGQNRSCDLAKRVDNFTTVHCTVILLKQIKSVFIENDHALNNYFITYKPMDIWVQTVFCELLLKRKLQFIRIYTQAIWRAFWPKRTDICQDFPAFKTSLKFGFLVYKRITLWRFCSIFVWFQKMELNPMLDLLNIGFIQLLKIIFFFFFFAVEDTRSKRIAAFILPCIDKIIGMFTKSNSLTISLTCENTSVGGE